VIRHIETPPHINAVDVPFMRKCVSLIKHYWKFVKKNPTSCNSVSKFIIPYLYEGQRVSGDTPPIIRSLKLHWQPLGFHTWKVVGRVVGGCCRAQMSLTMSNNLAPVKNQRLPVQF
jgi:hypothetical protein